MSLYFEKAYEMKNGGKISLAVLAALVLWTASATAADPKPSAPGKKDKCPVCGMFVYKYPDWVAQIAFSDGSTFFFDGAKDLFKYYFDLGKYNPSRKVSDIAAIWVTEYYDVAPLPAKAAFFVVGSDVYGPMGRELIPFKTMDAAAEFKKDHRGTAVLSFEQVTPAIIARQD